MILKHLKTAGLLLALVHLCLALQCNAQVKQMVDVQFVSFPILPDAQPVELIAAPGKTIEVELPGRSVSDIYRVERMGKWVIGKTEMDAEGNPVFRKYGEAPVIASKKQIILALCKGRKHEDGIELIVMDGNQKGFGGGKYLMYNASKVDIAGKLGDTKFMIDPGKHMIIQPKPNDIKRDRKFLHTFLFFRKDGAHRPFYSSTWRFGENVRNLVFIYHDPNNKRLRTHSIREHL